MQEIGLATNFSVSLKNERQIVYGTPVEKAYHVLAAGETKKMGRKGHSISVELCFRFCAKAHSSSLYPCQTATLIEWMRVRATSASPNCWTCREGSWNNPIESIIDNGNKEKKELEREKERQREKKSNKL